jgi:beta-lactamase regulating signal transducer with metallopeptidase domain
MYELLGICLALAALLTLNAASSLLAAILWRAVRPLTQHTAAATRANLLFAFRIFPPASALAFVLVLFIPAYVAHEPRITTEVVSPKLAVLALLSVVGVALAIWRGLMTWHATRRLVADWLSHAEPIRVDNISVPAFRVKHGFPVVAVVGSMRPRLFIAEQVFEALSDEELRAVVSHEAGHLAARDNLKRALVRASRDVLMLVPCGRSLDSAWAENAEAAADEYAARTRGSLGALDLAEAMIKISRAVQAGAKPTMPAGAFLLDGTSEGGVARRVRRLAELAAIGNQRRHRAELFSGLILWAVPCSLLLAITFMATNTQVLIWTHAAIERIVSTLR